MILFVGDIDDSVKNAALKYSSRAFLVDSSNFEKVLCSDNQDLVVYTSFADLPKMTKTRNVFFEILDRAKQIYYVPPKIWSDYSGEFDHWNQQRITEYFLHEVNRKKKNVVGLELSSWNDNDYLQLVDKRRIDSRQLWITGCSIPHGVGVNDSEKLGSLLSDRLNLPVSHLTAGGSSIPWAADQILRSDIRSGDILIWAVTSEYRYYVWDKKLKHFNPHNYQTSEDRTIGNSLENMLYRAVTSIHQVINFSRKIGATLILLPTIPSEALRLLFHDCPDWYSPEYRYVFLDIGFDGIHPGPKQHAEWANFCFDIIQNKIK